jgi:hypothetical protein
MDNSRTVEELFSENIDRLISGQEIRESPDFDQELKSALDFARLMKLQRPEPAPRFRSALKSRLLQQMAQQTSSNRQTWFERFIPRQPIWQAVAVLAVVLIVGGSVLGIILGNRATSPVAVVPSPTSGPTFSSVPATTVAAAPATSGSKTFSATSTTAAATKTTSSTVMAGIYLTAEANTDKAVYAPGDKVVINLKLKNNGSQPVVLTQFPPILSLMSAGNPVFSFIAGQNGRILAPGESVSFNEVWSQNDAHGNQVSLGRYYLELEDLDLQGQTYKLNLSQPVSFEISN